MPRATRLDDLNARHRDETIRTVIAEWRRYKRNPPPGLPRLRLSVTHPALVRALDALADERQQ